MRITRQYHDYPAIEKLAALTHHIPDTAFLDSSLQNNLGRYSILALSPYLKLVKGDIFTVNGTPSEESFEDFLRAYLTAHKEDTPSELPLLSGAIGYFSYDYGRKLQGVISRHPAQVDVPDCVLIFYDNFIIEDHKTHTLTLIANGNGQTPECGMEYLETLIREARDTDTVSCPQDHYTLGSELADFTADFSREDYMAAIDRMIRYIIEGDIYVVNMTQQLQIQSTMPPWEMFTSLREQNPSPFGGFLNYDDFQIVCASPERFLQMKKQHIQTRPIKGTRKRGSTPEEDQVLYQELADSKKDQSELLMIVDLERNDLNRVCTPGSVKVTELFQVETYATVFHLISNIEGELRPDLNVADLIEATFPGGSITGAPKLRAMELIDEQEHHRRNIYTGSLGYISLNGDCDFNIIIRTTLYQNGVYYLGVGGGITYESDLEFEYEETLQKAKALLQALHK